MGIARCLIFRRSPAHSELRRPYFGVSNRSPFQPIRGPDSVWRVQFYLACLSRKICAIWWSKGIMKCEKLWLAAD